MGVRFSVMLNLLFKNSENHKYFPLKTLYLYSQEVNINSFSHLGDNVSYPDQCFKLFDDSVMPSNILIWLFHSQTKMVPNGQKFTFSPELLILLPPHHQLSIEANPFSHLTHSVSIWTGGEWAELISPSTLFSNLYLLVFPFLSITIFTNLNKIMSILCVFATAS